MTFAPKPGQRSPTNQEVLSLELVSGFLMIIGFLVLAWMAIQIITHEDVKDAARGVQFQGLGASVQRVEPQPNITNQERFQLDVEADSPAALAGFAEGDLLIKIGDITLEARSQTEDDVVAAFSQTFTAAAEAGQTTIRVEVYRKGEYIMLDLPLPVQGDALELQLPIAGETEDSLGLEVDLESAEDLSPYYVLFPRENGPADLASIPQGAKLLSIDRTEITGEMSLAEVQALVNDVGVDPAEDDFVINIGYEFQQEGRSRPTVINDGRVFKQVPPALFIAVVDNFGFVVPLLSVVFFFMMLRLGGQLRRYSLSAARWALVVYLWLIVGSVVLAIVNFWIQGQGGQIVSTEAFNIGDGIEGALPFLLALIPLVLAYMWLSNVIHIIFEGDETLTERNTRFAWTLLVPTIAILILVAARPLEQTFIKSLTDDEFGTSKPARFIAFDNYQNLLDFRFASVKCQTDAETGDCKRSAGVKTKIIWELSEYEVRRENRYREALVFQLPWQGDTEATKLIAKDPQFINSFINTLQFTIASVALELLLGLIIALVVNTQFSGRGLMRTAMLVPWAVPTVVSAALWQIMLDDQIGIANTLLMDLGIIDSRRGWITPTGPWMNSIIAVDVWKTSPFMALLILAGLQTIPGDIYEAASVDGAGRVRQFFTITLPLLRPTIAVALIFRTLDALRVFDVFSVMLRNDVTRPSMATYNFSVMVNNQAMGYSSAVGVLIFVFILIFTILYMRFVGIEQQ